ncbi:MAG: HAMP domain-containing protein, partial [Phycisphaerales bacterium]
MSGDEKNPARERRGSAAFGLQARLTVVVIGMTFSVAWLACTFLVSSSTRLVRDEQSAYAMHTAGLLARAVAYAQAAQGRIDVNDVIREAIRPSRLIFADVYGADWKPIASSRRDVIERIPLNEDLARPLVGNPSFRAAQGAIPAHLEVIYPIAPLPDEIGPGSLLTPSAPRYVRVGVTVQSSLDWTSRTVDVLIGVGIMVGLLAVPLCFLLARRLVVPLERVIDTMNEFADGDLSVRAPVVRGDEIGMLADTFNAMADRHRLLFEWRGRPFVNDHLDPFFNASVDAGIVLATFVAAADRVGLGT